MSTSVELKVPQNLLAGKSNAELTKLSEDTSKLEEFFSTLTLEDLENAKKKKVELVNENKRLAAGTCSSKSRFESLKSALTDKSLEAAILKSDYEKRFAELKSFSSRNDHASILKALQQAKKTEEQNSDALVDGFLSGKQSSSVEEFVQQYLNSRRLYWQRKTKADKLEELMKTMQPKPAPRSIRTPSIASSMSKAVSQESPSAANPQIQPPYPPGPMASLPPSFPPQPQYAGVPPTQSLQYGRQPPPQPAPYQSYGPRPNYPPPTQPGPYPPTSYQPPPRPYSQPFPYPVYQPPYQNR